jgi:hypothetical protein
MRGDRGTAAPARQKIDDEPLGPMKGEGTDRPGPVKEDHEPLAPIRLDVSQIRPRTVGTVERSLYPTGEIQLKPSRERANFR